MKRLLDYGFRPTSDKKLRSSEDQPETSASSGGAPLQLASASQNACASQPPLVRNDIGTYTSADFQRLCHSDDEKFWLLHNVFRPYTEYKFPTKDEYGKKRSFQHNWIKQFPWLSYSVTSNGGYCVYCFLFAKRHMNLGQLVTSPMTNFTRAKVTLQEHEKQVSHKMASEDTVAFISRVERGGPSIGQLLQKEASASILKNRCKLKSILKSIVFCGKQVIALRGHCEQDSESSNPGNFRALLKFRVDAGDVVLEEHFKNAPKNATYTSPQIQNDLIACVGKWIRDKILLEVQSAKFFAVIADEAADCSNKEQLPLVLRFVDKEDVIREEFVDFIFCDTGTTGSAIAAKILEALNNYGLDLDFLRGQAYDGAGNMAGKYRGAAAVIQSSHPNAVYVHCAAHTLNLCVVAASSVQCIKNMMSTMVEICLFFSNSPKRELELEKNIKSMISGAATKLVNLCKTRWVARINALEVFYDLYPAVVKILEIISEDSSSGWNSESSKSAHTLLVCITQFEFIMAFIVGLRCLDYIKGLTITLQKRTIDICQAYNEVGNVQAALNEVREGIDTYHKKWFDDAVQLGRISNASEPQIPRRCNRQTARSNVPGDTPEVYYKRCISIPFIDELLGHLTSRFSDIQQKALKGLMLVPSVLMDSSLPHSTVEELKSYYKNDLLSVSSFETEFHLWKTKWTSFNRQLPDSPSVALLHAKKNMFPNIHQLLRIVCTLPATSGEYERSVSVLRRLKTYLRSTMSNERLSGLALMHTNYDLKLDFEEIINIFARKHPRRMTLGDILSD